MAAPLPAACSAAVAARVMRVSRLAASLVRGIARRGACAAQRWSAGKALLMHSGYSSLSSRWLPAPPHPTRCCHRRLILIALAIAQRITDLCFSCLNRNQPALIVTEAPGTRCHGHAGNAAKVAARRTLAPLPAVGAAAAAALPDVEVPSTPAQGVPAPQADVHVNEDCSESAAALMTTPDPAAASDCPAGVTPPSARFTPGQPAVASGLLAGFTPSPGSSARASLDKPRRPSPGSSAGEDEDEGVPASWLPAAAGGPQMAHGPKPAFVAWSSKGKAG